MEQENIQEVIEEAKEATEREIKEAIDKTQENIELAEAMKAREFELKEKEGYDISLDMIRANYLNLCIKKSDGNTICLKSESPIDEETYEIIKDLFNGAFKKEE